MQFTDTITLTPVPKGYDTDKSSLHGYYYVQSVDTPNLQQSFTVTLNGEQRELQKGIWLSKSQVMMLQCQINDLNDFSGPFIKIIWTNNPLA